MARNDKKTADTGADDDNGQEVAAAAPAEPNEGLVKMHKYGDVLHVHPTTVNAHRDAGWKVA